MTRVVVPYYWPPTLLAHQASVLALISKATGWHISAKWLSRLRELLRIAAGARKYGCFGYAPHPVYEVTTLCNLRCLHCHASGGRPYPGELDTGRAKKLIENLTTVKEFRMLVFTGGEPLMRKDIFELTGHARDLGFNIVYATNATLVSRDVAGRMARSGVVGAAVSIDSVHPEKHDRFRGVPGAWRRTIAGIKNIVDEGMYLQINITISKLNLDEMEDLLSFADRLGALVVLLYTFVALGRGEIYRRLALTPEEFMDVITRAADMQGKLGLVISPVAAPWYYAYLAKRSGLPPKLLEPVMTGCIAGRGMFYIKPNGTVWPCPFLPVPAGNAALQPAREIWEGAIFEGLRDRSSLGEPCRSCKYREICGGCRARAYLRTGRISSGDPICPLHELPITEAPRASSRGPRRTRGSSRPR